MKIYRNKFYILTSHPGISGFVRYDETEYRLATGCKAIKNKNRIAGEWLPTDSDQWAIEDGHLPEFQKIVRNPEAGRWLIAHPFQTVKFVQTIPARPYFK